ncbi:ABC transporter substrate-binding protein [Rhodoferax sp.]|uniref:ABC transporter substrate-binding protein n=1 Tax=Rhodoferax sp. TaxID=50421 RepID=UPI002625D005|nr:ABC transporter substrate-binding protein [Rhodoferax sp.]MDD2811372.1 ABC transporter substrate-binding protein [Rhodoferax sp.]MDD4944970.1 ABC transporter substrate-binding protein [Rhodoferax sp.]
MRTSTQPCTLKPHALARRPLLALMAATLLLPAASWAQSQKVFRIGVTKIVSHAALDADEKGFEAGLASSGFKEGVNVTYVRRNAMGDMAKADAIAREFVASQVDLIHAIATPTAQAVMRTDTRVPVVFSSVTDPVGAGIVPKTSAPGQKTGTHVTGLSDLWPVRLQFETYARAAPQAKTWGTIYNPKEANSVSHILVMREAAKKLGLTLVEATVSSSAEVGQAAASLAGKVQAITITSDNTTVANLEAIARVCDQHKIALFAGDIDSVVRGAVMAYGLDYFLVGYAAGKKAALVLKGIKPGDVPWGPVEKFSLVINTRAAKAQGLTLAPELLARADKVIN